MIPADGGYIAAVLPASLIAALGMSLAYIPATMTGMGGAAPEDTGLASGLLNTTSQVGSALGLAVMVSIASTQVSGAPHEAIDALSGYRAAFLGAAIVGLLAGAVALIFVRGRVKMADVPLA
jgi:hypothetical protein